MEKEIKIFVIALLGLIFCSGILSTPLTITNGNSHLLGRKQCTWGPSFWCSNITNAKSCNAVSHCIQTVWEKHELYPEDNDSICKICLDMVKQARDQLLSNETQDELKQVFEGSCNLIPVKIVRKECDKLADDFVPELIEALSSQMDPNTVCSVAGLCNNAKIDALLIEYENEQEKTKDNKEFTCNDCNTIGNEIEKKFKSKNRDELLNGMIELCGGMASYSDACSNIIIKYFNEIYNHMQENLNSDNLCHISGVCSDKYHKHDDDDDDDDDDNIKKSIELEIRPMSNVGYLKPVGDDIPCELCEQLVKHLRDVLVANTTELEFKQVLEGLCKQTHGFSNECLSIVDQYYDIIYETLTKNLDAEGACYMIGICKKSKSIDKTISPLVPSDTVRIMEMIKNPVNNRPKKLLGENEPILTNDEIKLSQLPIDKLMSHANPLDLVNGGEMCTLCEYFWHFVQETLATSKNEEEIKKVVGETCDKMPKYIQPHCHDFVNTYGDAVIALIIQDIDPTKLCPTLKLCPSEASDIEVFSPYIIQLNNEENNKPSCPLCLFAVTEAIERLRSNTSKEHIEQVLNELCGHLPSKLRPECIDFVDTYSKELIDLLASDFTPEQICVYFKLCTDNKPDHSILDIEHLFFKEQHKDSNKETYPDPNGDILTNEIPDNTVNGQILPDFMEYEAKPECNICSKMVEKLEKKIINRKSKEQVKYAVEHSCDKVLKKYRSKCKAFVKKHEDEIIKWVMNDIAPKEICRKLNFCESYPTPYDSDSSESSQDLDIDEAFVISFAVSPNNPKEMSLNKELTSSKSSNVKDLPQCVLCKMVMTFIEKEMQDKSKDEDIKNIVKDVCKLFPNKTQHQCDQFIDQYAELIIKLLATTPPHEICSMLMLCEMEKTPMEEEVLECAVCHATTIALEKILEDPHVEDDLDKVLDRACESLPGKYHKKCNELVSIYGRSMIILLKKYVEPEKICYEIGMCATNNYNAFVKLE